MRRLAEAIRAQVSRVVVGQDDLVDALLTAVALRGHVLIEGVPGTAKTLLARAFARSLDLDFARAQFTPDMLPSDLTGTMTLRGGELVFRQGPVFSNLLLADEINRTPPKTQAALLEAMQEAQVTIDGSAHPLPEPFVVVATQNPIEYEGTYPLPEAQLDRFLMKVDVGYPSAEDERALLAHERRGSAPVEFDRLERVAGAEQLIEVGRTVDATRVTEEVAGYVVDIVRATRALPSVTLGASPRAAVHLLGVAKAAARLEERDFVTPDDVAGAAPLVLAHRLIMSPEAELDRYLPGDAIRAAIDSVRVPR